jgi:hypothetical protein
MSKSSTGSNVWLDVGIKLPPGVDAGSGRNLTGAFSSALTHNATGVLSRLNTTTLTANNVCQSRYIEASAAREKDYQLMARAALSKVTDPKLTIRKKACLAQINR